MQASYADLGIYLNRNEFCYVWHAIRAIRRPRVHHALYAICACARISQIGKNHQRNRMLTLIVENVNSVKWNGGMDYWSGALDWTTGVPCPQIGCILGHAHNTKSFQAKDCTKCMSQGSLAA